MRKNKQILNYLIAGLMGVFIPVFFSFIDIWELQLQVTPSNLIAVLESQNIYLFSALFFPIIFIMMSNLVYKIRKNNLILSNEFEYLKVILNSTPDAIVFLNDKKEILFQNNQFRLLFDDFQNVLDETKLNHFFDQVEYLQREITVNSNLSETHPFLMSFKLTKYKKQRNYFLSFKDLKNLKDKEKIIQSQKNQMIEKNKLASLGEMAAGIAHEINNPLTVIHSNNSMLQRIMDKGLGEKSPDKIKRLTSKTTEQVERITRIITSLRNLSRGLANEEVEEFDIDQVINESIELAKIRDKSRCVQYRYAPRKFSVIGNRGQIVQVILNLINNAIDAIEAQDSPWIKVETALNEQETLSIKIIDSGEGIPENIVKKIFLPMYTTKDIGKGTGLGLSLSRNFIEENNGTLEYISSLDNTCFEITLPIAQEKNNAA